MRTGLEEADPALVEVGCWPFVPVGSESLVDAADHLPGPAGSLGGDADQRPVVAGEVFLAINVVVPLVTVGAVLIAFVLDDQLVLQVDQVDPAHRALVIADDHVDSGIGRPARTRQSRSQVSRGESTRSRTKRTAARATTTPR